MQKRGTECGERGEQGECYILGNFAKHSEEFCQTIRRMSPKIPGNVTNISGNVVKYSGECRKKFQTFRGISSKIPRNAQNGLTFKFNSRVPKHVLLHYLLFAVDLTSAKKCTKIMLSSKMLLYILSSNSLIFIYKSQLFIL